MAIQSFDLFSIRTRVHQENEGETEEMTDEESASFLSIENIFEIPQVEHYGVRKRSYTAVYDAVYDRLQSIYAPYTTVFCRITWSSITGVYLRDRTRRTTEKNGGRIRSIYGRKRPYFFRIRP
jgi:hypothetical protein